MKKTLPSGNFRKISFSTEQSWGKGSGKQKAKYISLFLVNYLKCVSRKVTFFYLNVKVYYYIFIYEHRTLGKFSFISLISILRGWSDNYLSYKRKKKVWEKWQCVFRHNLLLSRYTWFSKSPTLSTRLKYTLWEDLQNGPSSWISPRLVIFSSLQMYVIN